MEQAIALARQGMLSGKGGPFGCVIVRGEEIIGKGCNLVISSMDPTAHAEIVAIRDACKILGNFQLDECEVYTSCEPCPMCLGALYWARPKKIYYANSRSDAADIGFDDSFIYEEFVLPIAERKMMMEYLHHTEAIMMFEEWKKMNNKTLY